MLFKEKVYGRTKQDAQRTIYTSLKESIIGHIHVKIFEIWTIGSGEDVVKRKSYGSTRQDAQRTTDEGRPQ